MFQETNGAKSAINGIIRAWKGTIIDATRPKKMYFDDFVLVRAR